MKLDVVTYSYGKRYEQQIKDCQGQIITNIATDTASMSEDDKKKLADDLASLQD